MPGTTAIANVAGEDLREAPGTRRRILHATFELIGREGVAELSNRRIATEAGISLGSLTYHFPSQAELLRETLGLFAEEEVARMEAIAAGIRARCPGPKEIALEVQRLAAESVADAERIAELELHLRAARDPALQEASRRCFAAYEEVASAALEGLGVPEPQRHAGTVVALITGMGVRQKGGGRGDAAGLADALLTVVRGAES
jgi:TetR/AcrR family transcriptional regulator, regulator of biofilm formation and stress response